MLRICQDRYFEQAQGIPWEVVASDPTWNITTVAVAAIANWLETGAVAGRQEREEIASLGHAAAQQEARASIEASPSGRPSDPAGLSVALLTKLNLWWADATIQVLAEEAARLGTSPATLQSATDMVTASCKSSMVRMAKRYDAELQNLHDQLSHLARHDPLTGLANRPVLLAQLDKGIDRLERRPGGLAVAFVDLDNFKSVNDVLGHHCGDELLAALAKRFVSTTRPGDTVSRFGGDEFVALFEDLAEPSVEGPSLAERLRLALDEPSCIAGEQVYVTASVGLAVVTGPRCRSEDVLTQADTAMYASKRAGRNRVTCVEVTERSGAAPFAMASELRRAVEDRQLRLDYQPLWVLDGGPALSGFEALLRWDHPERGRSLRSASSRWPRSRG